MTAWKIERERREKIRAATTIYTSSTVSSAQTSERETVRDETAKKNLERTYLLWGNKKQERRTIMTIVRSVCCLELHFCIV